ncbi:MAG: hypothetical protein QM756_04595 [Polyangiaceae bacterium]
MRRRRGGRTCWISLDSPRVELIDVPAPAIALALGAEASLFARLEDSVAPNPPISIIDVTERSVLATRRANFGDRIAFHRATNRLLAGSTYGVGLTAFEYSPQAMDFTQAESSAEMSDPCYELALSPDQTHLFFACANATTPTRPAQGADFDPTNLASPFGIYANALGTAALTYSPGGKHLFTTASGGVAQHDVATRTLIATHAMALSKRLSVAPSGRVLMGGGVFALNEYDIRLSWKYSTTPTARPERWLLSAEPQPPNSQ